MSISSLLSTASSVSSSLSAENKSDTSDGGFVPSSKNTVHVHNDRMYFQKQLLGSDEAVPVENIWATKYTQCLSELLYEKDYGVFEGLTLSFYTMVMERIESTSYLRICRDRGDLKVILKGSNAQNVMLKRIIATHDVDLSGFSPDVLKMSDLDIVVLIRYTLPEAVFQQIQKSMHVLLTQCLSLHKKNIDQVFFMNRPTNDQSASLYAKCRDKLGFANDAMVDYFRACHESMMEKHFGSPSIFTDSFTRNGCSRNSFVICKDEDGDTLKKEIPSFERCEKLPLKRTPLFCSFNDTPYVESQDPMHPYTRNFDLYRLKLNQQVRVPVENATPRIKVELNALDIEEGDGVALTLSEQPVTKRQYVSAEFIDVTVLRQNDTELKEMWDMDTFEEVPILHPTHAPTIVTVPNLASCMRDTENVLRVYESPDWKKAKREEKLAFMRQILYSLSY